MKRFLWGILCAGLLASAGILTTPAHAKAAEGFNVITSPLPIKITTEPGKTVTNDLRIKNQGTQPEGIKVGLMKFGASGDTGQPNLYDLKSTDTYASWVSFSPQQFTAQPGVWNTIKMTIKVPPTAGLGYYLAVTFSPATVEGGRRVTSLKGSAATLVLLDVKSANEKRAIKLVDFSTDHKLYEYLPANFNIKLRNNGNIYLPPTGNIFITKGGKTVSTIDFNAAGGSVLPASNRVFKEPWTDGFPHFVDRLVDGKPVTDKHGKLKQDLKWDFTKANKLRMGKYTAKLLIAYDDGQKDVPIEAAVSFWVLPWKLMLVLLIILLIVGFGIYSFLRSAYGKARDSRGAFSRGRRR